MSYSFVTDGSFIICDISLSSQSTLVSCGELVVPNHPMLRLGSHMSFFMVSLHFLLVTGLSWMCGWSVWEVIFFSF